ncbi:ABC transporter ATP-binding protein, partial [Mesomycoplasma neurolyticum]|uniref:ABC transporter ATP-binding protein n=1 Tax=Mesomycoplasma neurolyticum TaxID=2120 RepID=UPI00101DEE7E
MSNLILEVKNLKVSIKENKKLIEIIRGIDFEIEQGQIIGLVGESGSGKTISSKALLGLNSFSKTTCEKMNILGINAKDFKKDKEWRQIRGKKIGYIPQDPLTALNPTRTIGKQLLDVLIKDKRFATKKEKKNYLINMLQSFGIQNAENIFNQYPHTLSGGMKQRVVIAMTVAQNPNIIVADEPTTALDPTVQASVLALFNEIRKQTNISIIFISHNISVIAKFCDYIYVLYAGKVIEKGTKKDIFTDPKHPYTWALIAAIPENKEEKLLNIKGTPPDLSNLPVGDPFAPRNDFVLEIDLVKEPPLFHVKDNHWAATWLLHPDAPKVEIPNEVQKRLDIFKEVFLK